MGFYGICIAIILVFWIYRAWSYNLYRMSGLELLIIPSKDWPLILICLPLGLLLYNRYRTGTNWGDTWIVEAVFWVLFISFWVFGYIQSIKITKDGFLHNGYFWTWREIKSWKWDNEFTLVFKVKPKFYVLKPLFDVKLKLDTKQKGIIERLLRENFPTICSKAD